MLQVHTQTLSIHTQSSEQPVMLRHPGSSWGFGDLLKGSGIEGGERGTFIPPTGNPCQTKTQTHNLSNTSPTL